ncbi:MAG TPA: hypothetical protein VLA74_10820 [Nitrososphaeraceae archaeon]|nr:hypothetical protein [Nitrososphaeraceae archaeon]
MNKKEGRGKNTKPKDNNTLSNNLLKFLSETNTKGYEICNVVDDDGDSIYTVDIEELAKYEGQVFISTNAIEKLVSLIIDQQQQRVGTSLNKNIEDD